MTKQDSVHTIFKHAGHFFSGTLLSRLSGLGRDIAMAYAFGAGSTISSFLVAFRLAHLLRRLFGESALNSGFIPIYEEFKSKNASAAKSFFINNALFLSFLLTILILALMGLLTLLRLREVFSSSANDILYLTTLMLPSLLFICLFGLNSALLQAEGSFFLPGIAPVFFNLIWILGALSLSYKNDAAMPDLCLFIILACFFQWAITLPKLYQKLSTQKSEVSYKWRLSDAKALFKPISLSMVGIAATQVNSALDTVFAKMASSEGPAYLWYAIRIEQFPLSLFGVALSTALLPPLTRSFKQGNLENGKKFLSFAIAVAGAILLPLTLALYASGETVVSLIFNHGLFNERDAYETAKCLYGYALGLVPQALVMILAPAFYAKKEFRLPVIASITTVILNIFLNSLFVAFHFGPSSIALATSLSSFVNVLILSANLEKALKGDLYVLFWKNSGKAALFGFLFLSLVLSFEHFTSLKENSLFDHFLKFSLHSLFFMAAFASFWLNLLKENRSIRVSKTF